MQLIQNENQSIFSKAPIVCININIILNFYVVFESVFSNFDKLK